MQGNRKVSGRSEVSVAETLIRTVVLVGLTIGFAAIFRFWHPAVRLVQTVAGTRIWQEIYTVFHVDSALGREQAILIGIIVVCFVVALLIQTGGLWAFRRFRG